MGSRPGLRGQSDEAAVVHSISLTFPRFCLTQQQTGRRKLEKRKCSDVPCVNMDIRCPFFNPCQIE